MDQIEASAEEEKYLNVKGIFKVQSVLYGGYLLSLDSFYLQDNLERPRHNFFCRSKEGLFKVNDFLVLTIIEYNISKNSFLVQKLDTIDGVILEVCSNCSSFYLKLIDKNLKCYNCDHETIYLQNKHSSEYSKL